PRTEGAPTVGVITMKSQACNSLGYLLRADAVEARKARRRLLVGVAFSVFLGGLLLAVGLAVVLLAASLLIVALVGGVSAVRVLRRNRHRLRHDVRSTVTHLVGTLGQGADRVARACNRLVSVCVARAARFRISIGRNPRQVDAHDVALSLNVAGAKHRR